MHEAYEVSHLLTVTVQIEAIAAYDGNLLLGTRQGHLLMYSLSSNNGNQKYELQLLRYCKNFSKKPIQQIDVIPEDNLLLCLTDNVLSTYDINGVNFPMVTTFAKTKGASLFALDNKSTTSMTGESNSVVRLCVAVRRKLQLYYGKNGEFKKHLFDFTIPDVPRVMAWGQQYLCVGYKAEYTLYDLSSGNPKELFPTSSSKSTEPTIAKYSDTSFLLGRDQTSVLVEEAKDIEIKKTIKWTQAPIGVVWDEPFILGLVQDEIRVQTVEPALFIQTLPELHKARLMYRCKRGLVFVSSVGQVWCISSVDITKQRQQLLKDKQFEIAIDITKLSECSEEEKKKSIRSIQRLYAYDLFDNGHYLQSMKEFIKLNTDPTEVIELFPELDGKEGLKNKKLVGEELDVALNALIEYLTELRSSIGQNKTEPGTSQEQGSQRNVTQQLELIDTTLLKCYLQTNDALVAPLLRLNNCRLEEAEKTLLQHGKHSELIILYSTKGHHTKALQLLKEQAKEPDSSLKGYTRTKTYLQNLGSEHINLIFEFSDWILKEHPEEGLKIFTEDIVEVENLPRPKILDFLLREHDGLVIPYLEHLIHTWNDTNTIFHDALIKMYRDKITTKRADITDEEYQHTKSKLVAFLEKSPHYTPERVILFFPTDSLFEERAVMLGKLGRHEQALAIYVQILGDVDRAMRYCENVCVSAKEKNQDVYVMLMRILMNPENSSTLGGPLAEVPRHPKTAVPDLEAALSILEKNADKISALKALSVLPDSVPLSRLKHFLESALESQLTLKRRTQVLKGLLYAEHMQTNDALVAPLLRLNNCRLEEAEKTLLQHGKHSELIILYSTKGHHTKALQLLKEQAKEPDSSLKGYTRTKTYLQNLGSEHINLIFEFSDWILKEHPEEGLKIFTEDIVEVENLPRPKILDFLLREHDGLVIPYLEHLIHTWNDTNTIFHDALIKMYRDKITTKRADITDEEYQHTKSKLVAFLEKSPHYTPERVILFFPTDSLFEERAVMLGKLGRHEQALAIYVQILGDVDRAMRYCENVCVSAKEKNQDVYVMLMRILMNPENSSTLGGPLAEVPRHPKTAVPDLEAALSILEKNADKISALKALSVLPDSVPLSRLKHFLESALESQLTLKRRTQVLKGLLYAEHMQVQELKQFHESKNVVINDYNVCPVCKKRFGNQSAFVRYPNGDIVHYSCTAKFDKL